MCHIWARGEVNVSFWWGKPEGKKPLGRLGIDGRIILKRILEKSVGMVWTELVWLRIWTSGRHV
jgi:hypothetical protein